jgi:hypothetical protein
VNFINRNGICKIKRLAKLNTAALYNKIIANDRKMYKKRPINFVIVTSTKSLDLATNLLLLRSGMREIDPKKATGNLEVVSKPQIRFKGKAQADRESAVRHSFSGG